MQEKILVSACLAGLPCRYDGKSKEITKIMELVAKGKLIPFCPEVSSGLPTHKIPSEIKDNKVYNKEGKDMTEYFKKGAENTLKFCQENNIKKAVLKQNSPSCGSKEIYDGSFTGTKIEGSGMTARLLKENNIEILDEDDFLKEIGIE